MRLQAAPGRERECPAIARAWLPEHLAQVLDHPLRVPPVRVDRANRLHDILKDRGASQERAGPHRLAVPENAMPPTQSPEFSEVLVGPEHPANPATDEITVRLTDLPSGDADTDRVRLLRPADGYVPRTGFRHPYRPSQVIAVFRERSQISPAVGPGREAGVVAKTDGDR